MQGRTYSIFFLVFIALLCSSLPQNIQSQSFITDSTESTHKKLWSFLFQPGFVLSSPTGDAYSRYTSGVGFDATLFLAANRHLLFGLSVKKSGVRLDKDHFPTGVIIKDDLSASVWAFHALLGYYSYFSIDLPGKGMTYTYIGLGSTSHSVSGEVRVQDGSLLHILTVADAPARLSIPIGLGIQIGLSRSITLNCSGQYTFVTFPQSSLLNQGFFDFKVGLGFYIPQLGRY